MKRVGRKGEGRFEAITWDEALDTIARRFAGLARSTSGPQTILPFSYYGTMGKLQASSLDRRFFHRLGASKLDRTICSTAGNAGYEYTLGAAASGLIRSLCRAASSSSIGARIPPTPTAISGA